MVHFVVVTIDRMKNILTFSIFILITGNPVILPVWYYMWVFRFVSITAASPQSSQAGSFHSAECSLWESNFVKIGQDVEAVWG